MDSQKLLVSRRDGRRKDGIGKSELGTAACNGANVEWSSAYVEQREDKDVRLAGDNRLEREVAFNDEVGRDRGRNFGEFEATAAVCPDAEDPRICRSVNIVDGKRCAEDVRHAKADDLPFVLEIEATQDGVGGRDQQGRGIRAAIKRDVIVRQIGKVAVWPCPSEPLASTQVLTPSFLR